MTPNRTVIAGASPPDRSLVAGRSQASAQTNTPMSRWNGRSALGRRCKDLFRSYWKQAGNPTEPATQAAIMSLAEQTVISELARSDCLADGGMTKINLELVIRAENLANRTLRRLKLDKSVSSKRAGPTLEDIKARYSAPAAPATGEAGE
jgi:hypothetical protein